MSKNLIIFLIFYFLFKKCFYSKIFASTSNSSPSHFFNPSKTFQPSNHRILQAQIHRKIKIKFIFLNFEKKTPKKISQIFYQLKTYLKKIFKVTGPTIIQKFNSTKCDKFLEIPQKYKTNDVKSDLLIFVKSTSTAISDARAMGTVCGLDTQTFRPNIGLIILQKPFFDDLYNSDVLPFVTILHESFHILGFSKLLFPFFKTKDKIIKTGSKVTPLKDKTTDFVISPKVIELTKLYFNCSTATGAPLENEGGVISRGSHWEKSVFGNELMTASHAETLILSEFTLAILEDSGWYKVDYSFAGNMTWGKNKGCGFLENVCHEKNKLDEFSEFCEVDGMYGCTNDYLSKSVCSFNPLSDECMFNDYISGRLCSQKKGFWRTSDFEVLGKKSRCFQGVENNIKKSVCLNVECESFDRIKIKSRNNFVYCEKSKEFVRIGNVIVRCPKINHFCDEFLRTVNKCGKNSINFSGKCICRKGWFGETCKNKSSFDRNKKNKDADFPKENEVEKKNKMNKNTEL